jgi:small subunit ribosomal protein S17
MDTVEQGIVENENIENVEIKDTGKPARNLRKTRVGMVVSNKMDKTVVVEIKDSVRHALYKKTIKRAKKFKAHDEENTCNIGDRVMIMETRPLSKDKRWRLVKVLERAK